MFGDGIEHELGAYLKPYRTLASIEGKKGVPKLNGLTGGWQIVHDANGINVDHSIENPIFKIMLKPKLDLSLYSATRIDRSTFSGLS